VSAFKDRMVELNERIRWVPAHAGQGRFADWLRNARDWAVSRNRFWGAPVPVWRCESCSRTEVVGSRAQLEGLSGQPLGDWHRPEIDAVVWPCAAGDGVMRRVPEVLDCWFESGAMPYGQAHYPFDGSQAFEAAFPGDFIVEYVAQTRGWFYTMLALSTALLDREPFRNAVCHGVLLAEDGRKMSKRLRNFPDPMVLVEEHGSDALRAALLMSGAVSGADIRFAAASVRDSVRRFHLPLWNALHLFTAYAALDGFEPTGGNEGAGPLDRYLLAETEALRASVEAAMAGYDFASVYGALDAYLVMLSTWYLRLVKPTLWQSGLDARKRAAYEAFHAALTRLVRIAAPFLPFLADSSFAALGGEDSIHLSDWPSPRPEWEDAGLLREMRAVRDVAHLGHQVREQGGVRHRQPLCRALVHGLSQAVLDAHRPLLEAELNVKAVSVLTDVGALVRQEVALDYRRLGKRLRRDVQAVARAISAGALTIDGEGRLEAAGHVIEADEYTTRYVPLSGSQGVAAAGEHVVVLDLTIDEALSREGQARDLCRVVQDLRKQAGLAYEERVAISLAGSAELASLLLDHGEWLKEQCLAVAITRDPPAVPLVSSEVQIGGGTVSVSLARA
jgi:isoleucyl-tRNA synthetase